MGWGRTLTNESDVKRGKRFPMIIALHVYDVRCTYENHENHVLYEDYRMHGRVTEVCTWH